MKKIFKLLLLTIVFCTLLGTETIVLAFQNPVVSAGPDLYLSSGQTISFQATGYDPNGFSLNYYWTCTGGNLSNYNILQPIYTAPYAAGQATYNCTITATNNYGTTNSSSMTIYVNYGNNYNNYNTVQTNYASYVSNSQAILNGTIPYTNQSSTNYAFFQWGTTTNYGNQTSPQALGYSGSFMQALGNLNPGTLYHFRAVEQNNYGTFYGQDLTFTTTGTSYYNNYNYNNQQTYPNQIIYQPTVLGASTVNTGLTDNFWVDSFFMPLLLILAGLWLYFSGKAFKFADWLKKKV